MPRRSSDPIKTGARKGRAKRRIGQGAACTKCGQTNGLVASSRPRLCGQCFALKCGKKPTETHHLAGKANSAVAVEVSVKDHGLLSEAQYEWPPSTLQNSDGSPLLSIAAYLRGAADFVGDLVVEFIHHLAEFIEKIDAWLREQYGLWWKGGPFEGWQPGRTLPVDPGDPGLPAAAPS